MGLENSFLNYSPYEPVHHFGQSMGFREVQTTPQKEKILELLKVWDPNLEPLGGEGLKGAAASDPRCGTSPQEYDKIPSYQCHRGTHWTGEDTGAAVPLPRLFKLCIKQNTSCVLQLYGMPFFQLQFFPVSPHPLTAYSLKCHYCVRENPGQHCDGRVNVCFTRDNQKCIAVTIFFRKLTLWNGHSTNDKLFLSLFQICLPFCSM